MTSKIYNAIPLKAFSVKVLIRYTGDWLFFFLDSLQKLLAQWKQWRNKQIKSLFKQGWNRAGWNRMKQDEIGQDETGGPLKIITTLPLTFVNTWKGISNDFYKTSVNKPLNHIYSKFALQFVFYWIYSVFIYLMFILWV